MIRIENITLININNTFNYNQFLNKVSYTNDYLNSNPEYSINVGILTENDENTIISILSCWKAKKIPVLINPKFTDKEIYEILNKTEVNIIVSDLHKTLSGFFQFNVNEIETTSKEVNYLNLEICEKDEAIILLSSGTTNLPKAVVHTFANLINASEAFYKRFNTDSKNNFVLTLPLFHIGGFMIFFRAIYLQSAVIFGIKKTDILTIQSIQNNFSSLVISLVPTMLKMLLDSGLNNKNISYVFLGGGPSNSELVRDSIKEGLPIVKVYGSTETCAMVAAAEKVDLIESPEISGLPLGNNMIFIPDTDKDGYGEIFVYSDYLFKEYFSNKDLTYLTKNKMIYKTGDIGKIDNCNRLTVIMRREDLIVSGGENINPFEIEKELLNIKEISETVVLGVEDEYWGQKTVAFLVLKENSNIDIQTITEILSLSLAKYKHPKEYIFLKEIPKTDIGKTDRKKLNFAYKKTD